MMGCRNIFDFEDLKNFDSFQKIKPKSHNEVVSHFVLKLDSYCIPGYQNESTLSRFDKFIDELFVGSKEALLKTIAAINKEI